MKMKKSLSVILTVIALLLASCSNWMKDDDLYSDIENDVKVANASKINVYVRYAMTRQGKTDPEGTAIFKVGIPKEISATTEPEYGFVRWAAFSTDFLATGDNQNKNKNFYYVDDEDFKERLAPHEISAPDVVFEDPKNPTTKVTINVKRDDLFLVPIIAQRPSVALSIPASGSNEVVRNMAVRISFSKPMDPESFKNADGEFDKITVTQGSQTITAGEIEITSEDITDHFQDPIFSANGKMITLKFTAEAAVDGYASKSSVQITISKEVKDIFGFEMVDDAKISFTAGSSMDSYAPRIKQLTAGPGADFGVFQGMYKDAGTVDKVGGSTEIKIADLSSSDSAKTNLASPFYTQNSKDKDKNPTNNPIQENRVTNKIVIRVVAEDISQTNNSGIESDVALIGIRSKLLFDKDGNAAPASDDNTISLAYVPQGNTTSIKDKSYKQLVEYAKKDDSTLDGTKGCLYEYDLSAFPDGLIQIDVAAVDSVSNNGFTEFEDVSKEYGNGYATIFVIKDTTAPTLISSENIKMVKTDGSGNIAQDNIDTANTYYNVEDFQKIAVAQKNTINDYGHSTLRSPKVYWIVKPAGQTITKDDPAWKETDAGLFGNFPVPAADTNQKFCYALKDDLGNMTQLAELPVEIKFDKTIPDLSNMSWTAGAGSTPGFATGNILNNQTLEIPVKEITSGLHKVALTVTKQGGAAYTTPFADSNLTVLSGDTELVQGTDYTVQNGILTFANPKAFQNYNSNIKIKGLKLSDSTDVSAVQGTYELSVTVWDYANNPSTAKSETMYNDSTNPTIEKIVINNIKKAFPAGHTASGNEEYWVDYTKLNTSGSLPTTDVYVEFKEEHTGATVFDFGGANSTLKLTDASRIYKVSSTSDAAGTLISGTSVNGTANTITIGSQANAVKSSSANAIVRITNVQLAPSTDDSKLTLKLHDVATNASSAETRITSTDGSLNAFRFDSGAPTVAQPTLVDNGTVDAPAVADCIAAEDGYTNSRWVNSEVVVTPTISGIYSLTIDGDAEFETGNTNTTVLTDITDSANPITLYFDVSQDKKTATFKTSGAANTSHSFIRATDSTDSRTIKIENLRLSDSDGDKSVKFKAKSFAEVQGSSGTERKIVLDKTAPTWINEGLYTTTDNSVDGKKVYPHPDSDNNAYGLTGIASATDTELYFYRSEKISIKPDVNDDNKKDGGSLIEYKYNGAAVSNSYDYYSTTNTGSFTAVARDKAGNKSVVKTFHIVGDSTFAVTNDELGAIDQYMTLSKPEGAFIHRNANGGTDGKIAFVIKGDAQYQIKVKLGGALATDETIDNKPVANGGTQLLTTPYVRKDNTITSSKIEKYLISTNITYPEIDSDVWKPYAPSSATFTTNGIESFVDENGAIVINIPNDGCEPLVLFLMDGCGNRDYRRIRPAGMTSNIIQWVADSEIGVDGYRGDTISCVMPTAKEDITFYNASNTPVFTLGSFSENCRFDTNQDNHGAVGDSQHYSLKSRIIVWTDEQEPERSAFYNTQLAEGSTASAWYYYKECDTNINGSTEFNMTNTFPKYVSTASYQLWYIVEDTVGNTRIAQIKNGTEGAWLYDNTKPEISDVLSASKINTVGDTNYYSDNSSVTYTVTDAHSGIKNSGANTYTYSSFDGRKTQETITYSLKDKTTTSGKLTIAASSIEDWAGNTMAAAKELKYNTKTSWVRQASAPELTGIGSTKKATAVKTSTYGDEPKMELKSDSETEGQILKIKAQAKTRAIQLRLAVTDDTELLGWIISSDTIDSPKDFYTASEMTSGIQYDSSKEYYTYEYAKPIGDHKTEWSTYAPASDKYFYPVNRAGLIGKPILVTFAENPIPAITTDGITYNNYAEVDLSDSAPSTAPTITKAGNIYYIKAGAKLHFTTTNEPNTCRIYYNDLDTDDETNTHYKEFTLSSYLLSGTTATYEIPLDDVKLQSEISSTSGTPLKLTLHTPDEDSVEDYSLKGPGDDSNLWVYDSSKPTISIDTFTAATSEDSNDTTKYIQSETATIKFTTSESGTGIAHRQWRWKTDSGNWTAWKDIASTDANANYIDTTDTLTFNAPDLKTQYEFRLVDNALNISIATTTIKLQRDKWAPTGTFSYTTEDNENVNLISKGLDVSVGTDATSGADIREIKYSSESTSAWYINKIVLDLSQITDKHDNINRAGIKEYQIIKDDGVTSETTTVTANATSAEISLGDNTVNTVYTYTVKVIDNIRQEEVLKIFKTQADNEAPKLEYNKCYSDDAKTKEAVSSVDTSDSTKYLKGDKAVMTFVTDDVRAKYSYLTSASAALTNEQLKNANWTSITTTAETLTSTSFTYSIDAPATKTTYYFKAEDIVGNISFAGPITVQKDVTAPSGTVTYSLTGGTLNENYVINDSGAIKYKAGTVTALVLDLSGINDNENAAGLEGVYLNGSKLTSSSSPSLGSNNKVTITLATADAVTNTYTITAKDNIGNESASLLSLTLISDKAAPVLAHPDTTPPTDPVWTDVGTKKVYYKASESTYYIGSSWAIVEFVKPAADTAKYMWKKGDGSYTQFTTDTNVGRKIKDRGSTVSLEFNPEFEATTYTFYAVDDVGNEGAEISVKLVEDDTAPVLQNNSSLDFTVKTATGTAVQTNLSAATPVIGDYTLSVSNGVTTIVYNANVKTLEFDLSKIVEAGAGLEKLYYKLESSETENEMGGTNGNVMTLSDSLNNTTYLIYAKDLVGNASGTLRTIKFISDTVGPKLPDSKVTAAEGVNMINGYTARKPNAAGNGYVDLTEALPYVTVKKIGNKQKANLFIEGTQIMYAKTDLTDAVQYQIVQTTTTDSNNGYNATANASNWQFMNDGTDNNSGSNYVFTLPSIHEHHKRLALFFKDAVGNEFGPYYLGNNGTAQNDYGVQWWLSTPELSTSNITIDSVCLLNDDTKTGWQGVQNDYLVKMKLPKNAVVHSIEFAPAAGNSSTGVVIALGANNEVKDQIFFTGYTATGAAVTSLSTACINLAASTEVGLTLKIYVWDKNASGAAIGQTDVKVIINGIAITVFPSAKSGGNVHENRISSRGVGIMPSSEIFKFAESSGSAAMQSRIVELPVSIQNAVETYASTVNDAAEKVTSAVKKTGANKAPAKKAAEKTVAEKVVEEVASVVSTATTTELPAEALAVTDAADQVAMLLPQSANTKQEEPQASVATSLVDTAATSYDEAPQDNLVLKLVIALAALVLCGAFGLVLFLKKKVSKK